MKLMNTSDVKYLRRLVKELRNRPDGFRDRTGNQCNDAKVSGGRLYVRYAMYGWSKTPRSTDEFVDQCGREIVASREQ